MEQTQTVDTGRPLGQPKIGVTGRPGSSLPIPATALIGQDRCLSALSAELRTGRLVTITGSGGIGKTRVALEVARLLDGEFAMGAWWVDLSAVRDPQVVPSSVLAAIGGREDAGRGIVDILDSWIVEPMLIVLDNCEHLIGACAELVESLLARNGWAKVLVTSREPLGSAGEIAWRLPSLDAAAAVELFTARVRRIRPELSFSSSNLDSSRRICERLDGIPLAIELAAARCRQMSPDRIADQLDDLFALLTGGLRTAVARQRTLLASIEWSHELLDPLERITLRRLGIFTGPFDLEAAECVVSDPGGVDHWSVMDLLGRLVDKNLLIAEPDDRYRLLETMRQFALDQLRAASEVAVSRDAHLRWFGDRLRERVPSDGALTDSGARWLTVNHAHLVTALDWAAAHDLEAFVSITDRLHSFWYLAARQGQCSAIVGPMLETVAAQGLQDVRAHLISRHAMALVLAGHRMGSGVPVLEEIPSAVERCFAAGEPVSACWGAYAVKLADIGAPFQFAELAVVASDAGSTWTWFWQAMAARIIRIYFTADPFDGRSAEDLLRAADFARHHQATRTLLAAVVGTEQVMRGDLRAAAETLYPELETAEQQPAVAILIAGAAGCVALMTGDEEQLQVVLQVMAGLARTSEDAAKAHRLLQDLGASRDAASHDYSFSYWDLNLPPTVNLLHWLHIWSVGSDGVSWPGTDPTSSRGVRIRLTDSLAARANGRWSEALTLAHAALAGAADSGLEFLVVDALETLASIESGCGDVERAALLLGAAERRREELGYQLRFPIHQAALQPLFELSAPLAEGRGIDITRAVEIAGRARGERNRPRIGLDSLTPTERRVAQLVRGGLTNSQIAAEMIVSAETVKTHLKHINAKLDIGNRTQLAALIPPA